MTFSKLQSSTGTFMRVRISLRLGGAPVAIAMLSPDGRRGAADQGWVVKQGNQTIFTPCFLHTMFSSHGVFNGTLGQCPGDMLLRWTHLGRRADLCAVRFVHGRPLERAIYFT